MADPQNRGNSMTPLGIIFDLDGTLVDSGLDFDLMRQEMDLPPGLPILESLASLPPSRIEECLAILARHETEGELRATLMPGVKRFLEYLDETGIRRAIVTRNTRERALATLDRLQIPFDLVLGREDAPVKPDPAALWQICAAWDIPPQQVWMIGDFRFDMEAGRRAGTRTVLYTAGQPPHELPDRELADHCLVSFEDAPLLLLSCSQ